VLDGALGTDARARRARLGSRARLWVENLPMGSHFTEGGARRGMSVARPWCVGRGEPISLREHRRTAPRVLTVPTELTKGCLWGGSAPPNGSRLSCGRPARWRKAAGRQSVPHQGHNTPFPLKRSPPASFKRLLGSSVRTARLMNCRAYDADHRPRRAGYHLDHGLSIVRTPSESTFCVHPLASGASRGERSVPTPP